MLNSGMRTVADKLEYIIQLFRSQKLYKTPGRISQKRGMWAAH